jgi:hypothetical protein
MAQSQQARVSFSKSLPYLSPGQIKEISGAAAAYISTQRNRYWASGTKLPGDQIPEFSAYFRGDLLKSVRSVVLGDERILNPPFYSALRAMGFTSLPDFSLMRAVTFKDTVVSNEACSPDVLFHELVHAEQYRQLGVKRFAELYVYGFLAGGSYAGIPLEVNAYELGGRFEDGPKEPFSVEAEVASWISRHPF